MEMKVEKLFLLFRISGKPWSETELEREFFKVRSSKAGPLAAANEMRMILE